eukprot:UN09954
MSLVIESSNDERNAMEHKSDSLLLANTNENINQNGSDSSSNNTGGQQRRNRITQASDESNHTLTKPKALSQIMYEEYNKTDVKYIEELPKYTPTSHNCIYC